MQTILVPTEDHEARRSALETALQLARRFDAYIEGFALRWDIRKFVAMEGVPLGLHEQDIPEEEKQACQIFESFMREHGVARKRSFEPRLTPAARCSVVIRAGYG